MSSGCAWGECNRWNSELKRREGKPKDKGGRRENIIDFRRKKYRQLPIYIGFDRGNEE
jgi:hypothetical protein